MVKQIGGRAMASDSVDSAGFGQSVTKHETIGLARRICQIAMGASLALCWCVLPGVASAQTAPSLSASSFERLDENGVDLISGRFSFKGARRSAGASPRSGEFQLWWNGSVWGFPAPSVWSDGDGSVQINNGRYVEEFDKKDGVWVSLLGNSSKLICSFYSDVYVKQCDYTSHDGIVGKFTSPSQDKLLLDPDFSLPNGNIASNYGIMTYPTGQVVTSKIENHGIQIIRRDGWTLEFRDLYDSNSTAKLYSDENPTTEVDSISIYTPRMGSLSPYLRSAITPEDGTQTMTERDGSVWRFTFSDDDKDLTRIRRPGSTVDDLVITYDDKHRVLTLTNELGTWQYAYVVLSQSFSFETGLITLVKTTVTKPDGSQYYVTSIKKKGNIRSHQDELGRLTTYNYDTQNRLSEVIAPELNRSVYAYDGRGNMTSVTKYATPGSPEAQQPAIVERAEYSASCPNIKNCNQPIAVIDANGNRTDYTYFESYVASETKPSSNGTDPRPQTRWTHATIQARALKSTGELITLASLILPVEKSECLSGATCGGTSDEVKTTFDYGPATGPNPAYLRGTAVTWNGQIRRTCYDYDARGNKIAERSPKANLDACYTGGTSNFAVADVTATEGGSLAFVVTKTGTSSTNLSVDYASSNGSAIAGSDYTGASGTLTFTPTDTTKTVTIATTDDTSTEGAETVLFTLSNATNNAGISDGSAIGTINDNDGGGGTGCSGVSFQINDAAQDEGTPLIFTVTKTGATSTSCSVNYASANGTAITPNDYATVSGTLTFASNETTKTVSITTTTTGPSEADENMYVNLTAPTGSATISDSQGVGTIYNYDAGGGGCPLC
jgi:YD repeat-containing protein